MGNDTEVIKEGMKVGTSEAALLTKLGVKPFMYGLSVKYVYEGGIFDPSVLKITDASFSLALGYVTEASLGHLIVGGVKNLVAVALEAEYLEFEAVKKVKAALED